MTIFQTNILFITNQCHHGGPLGAEGQGQLPAPNPTPPTMLLNRIDLVATVTTLLQNILLNIKKLC